MSKLFGPESKSAPLVTGLGDQNDDRIDSGDPSLSLGSASRASSDRGRLEPTQDCVFELVQQSGILSYLYEAFEQGPREQRQSDLDALIDRVCVAADVLVHVGFSKAAIRATVAENIMKCWRRKA